jgi:L-alanine-DL-glutamate epimerase-like enolase superfamily enzyme
VGGIPELKWIAEYADLHGILMAPHGTGDGVFGLAALLQVCATLPNNFIAFEYPIGQQAWWYDIVEGLPARSHREGRLHRRRRLDATWHRHRHRLQRPGRQGPLARGG